MHTAPALAQATSDNQLLDEQALTAMTPKQIAAMKQRRFWKHFNNFWSNVSMITVSPDTHDATIDAIVSGAMAAGVKQS